MKQAQQIQLKSRQTLLNLDFIQLAAIDLLKSFVATKFSWQRMHWRKNDYANQSPKSAGLGSRTYAKSHDKSKKNQNHNLVNPSVVGDRPKSNNHIRTKSLENQRLVWHYRLEYLSTHHRTNDSLHRWSQSSSLDRSTFSSILNQPQSLFLQ